MIRGQVMVMIVVVAVIGRLIGVLSPFGCVIVGHTPLLLTEEGHEHLAAHVERRHQRGHQTDRPQRIARTALVPRPGENLVFRPEPRERRNAGDRQPTHDVVPAVIGMYLRRLP